MRVLSENSSFKISSVYKAVLTVMVLFVYLSTMQLAQAQDVRLSPSSDSDTAEQTLVIAIPVDPTSDTSNPVEVTTDSESTPLAYEVTSVLFPDPELWYNQMVGMFTWNLPADITIVSAEIATSSDNVPSVLFDTLINEFEVSAENLVDGVQYLSVQFKNESGWGSVTNHKIQIDTTPPEVLTIDVLSGTSVFPFPLLLFEAQDSTSGIDYYVLSIDNGESQTIFPNEARRGYILSELLDGTYTATVSAFDKAGNQTMTSIPVLVAAGWSPEPYLEKESYVQSVFTDKNILIVILALVVLGECVYIAISRKQSREKEEKLRREALDVQEQMRKIFSALRDEIYEQVHTITKYPKLSAKEKEAVEGLHKALEVSETLIGKEIDDVQTILM
jgi:hypothetical protein